MFCVKFEDCSAVAAKFVFGMFHRRISFCKGHFLALPEKAPVSIVNYSRG